MSDISRIVDFVLKNQQDTVRHGRLPMWTIYDRPAGFPDCYVARLFEIGGGSEPARPTKVMLRTTGPQQGLTTLRAAFEGAGLHCMPRSAEDEPQIVESWV